MNWLKAIGLTILTVILFLFVCYMIVYLALLNPEIFLIVVLGSAIIFILGYMIWWFKYFLDI